MRTFIPVLAALFVVGCSSSSVVMEKKPAATKAITELENPDVAYDRQDIQEVELDNASEDAPKVIQKTDPHYPEIALRAGLNGTVMVHVLIAPTGRVRMARVLRTDAEVFNQSALEAALQWMFEPPVVNGAPAAVWVTIPFRFAVSKK